jgi:hypothetical protein
VSSNISAALQVYVGELDCDPGLCFSRNIHGRDNGDIERLFKGWEPTPGHMHRVSFVGLSQDKEAGGGMDERGEVDKETKENRVDEEEEEEEVSWDGSGF